jgi:hypothetical protein
VLRPAAAKRTIRARFLLEGLDWPRVHEARETAPPTQAG